MGELDPLVFQICPKCDGALLDVNHDRLYEIDVCHNGADREEARRKILNGLNRALLGGYSGLLVIHGYGSGRGHSSFLKGTAQRTLREIAHGHGYELEPDRSNPGVTRLLFDVRGNNTGVSYCRSWATGFSMASP
jgi:hypothetical protein